MASTPKEEQLPLGPPDEWSESSESEPSSSEEDSDNNNHLSGNGSRSDGSKGPRPEHSSLASSSKGRSANAVDLRNEDHLKMLLQATSTEDQIRDVLRRPEHQHRSPEERQQIVNRALRKMADFGALDPKVLEYGGKAYESHRKAVRVYLGSLIDAVSGDLGEAKLLPPAMPNLDLDSPRRFRLQTPRLGLEAAGPDGSTIFGPRWDDVECLGKGAFGSVWACKNLMDGEIYAVKRIIITNDFLKIASIADFDLREKAFAELHHEVKVLARLDHPNIVRYYGSWMERMAPEDFEKIREKICPEGMSEYTGEDSNLSYEDSDDEDEDSDDEDSDEEDADDDEGDNGDDEDGGSDDDSERDSNSYQYYSENSDNEDALDLLASKQITLAPPSINFSDLIDFPSRSIEHSSSHNPSLSGNPLWKSSVTTSGSELEIVPRSELTCSPPTEKLNIHILSIQMAKYSLSLNEFLTTPTDGLAPTKDSGLGYKFQPRIAVELLLRIADGVEYMHHHHLVHRDLKPANIFLKVEHGAIGNMQGSVRVSGCKCSLRGSACPEDGGCLPGSLCWVTPKIGDFGLTADIKRTLELANGKKSSRSPLKSPIGGTVPYMPPSWAEKAAEGVEAGQSRTTDKESTLHLTDAYALGIIFFELLHPFATISERYFEINKLREQARHEDPFPNDFCHQHAPSLRPGVLATIKALILRLTCGKTSRMAVSELKLELENLLERI
ncbi:hypothetical protein DRE_02233 [Drechslerella stenobrocha 248]|uniref:non-specific serine/threonine protein kinase n=1 Tax=Drechslerella stenobrocha 248 TaxID=1043628 RepID=W7HYB7_9PEZI|nr:hypothetical protein DRE_02233 [Drechslerella stenobrocha 248]